MGASSPDRWSFTLTGAGGIEVETPLSKATLTLGRSKDGGVFFADASVSRGHAKIEVRDGECWLEDIDTPDGAHVNNVRISERRLHQGDHVRLGFCDTDIVVKEVGDGIRLIHGGTEVLVHREGEDRLAAEVILPGDEWVHLRVAGRGEERRFKYAAVATIIAHFGLFLVNIEIDRTVVLPAVRPQATVIKRYKPPEPPKPDRPVRRGRVRAVPIPDPTPGEPEPLVMETIESNEVMPDTDAEFVTFVPDNAPLPVIGGEAYEMDTVGLVPPRVLSDVQPDYNSSSARRGVQGDVDIEVVIDENGRVAFARIINGVDDEELDQAALEAARQWRFVPASLGGEFVPVKAVVKIRYRIK